MSENEPQFRSPIAPDGKRRKFLCVIDKTPECSRAVQYAARRAKHTHGGVLLLYVLPQASFQHWAAVEELMREEAREEADAYMLEQADRVFRVSGAAAELVFREGDAHDEILALIKEDEDIAVLVLAAASGKEGPGPLVSAFAARDVSGGGFPIPLTLVPGHLSDTEINALA